jgi:ABC-type multidrug transport system permease subunit
MLLPPLLLVTLDLSTFFVDLSILLVFLERSVPEPTLELLVLFLLVTFFDGIFVPVDGLVAVFL